MVDVGGFAPTSVQLIEQVEVAVRESMKTPPPMMQSVMTPMGMQMVQVEPLQGQKRFKAWGNTKVNLPNLLWTQIASSQYFKDLLQVHDLEGVLREIYSYVTHLKPYVKGGQHVPSSAFTLLVKMSTLMPPLTEGQITDMLEHPENPYVRAMGFLYLRLRCNPKEILSWFEDYLADEEEIDVEGDGSGVTTIGRFCRSLLREVKYYSIYLPRFSRVVMNEVEAAIGRVDKQYGSYNEPPPPPVEDKRPVYNHPPQRPYGGREEHRGGSRHRSRSTDGHRRDHRRRSRSRERRRSRSRERRRIRSRERRRSRSRDRYRRREEGEVRGHHHQRHR